MAIAVKLSERLLAVTIRHIQAAAQAFYDRGWNTELVLCDNNSNEQARVLVKTAWTRGKNMARREECFTW